MSITNTSEKEVHPEWTMGRNPKAIEAQEKRGQDELVNSEVLPVRCTEKEILEKDGVEFGDPLPNDELFCKAELPSGWKKIPTDHSMWSKLIDEQGRERASIFYKAAFYDRNAFMTVTKIDSEVKDWDSIVSF